MLPQHHKQLSLDLLLPDGCLSGPDAATSSAIAAGLERELGGTRTRPQPRRKGACSPELLDGLERQALQQQMMVVDGRQALVALTASGIQWSPAAAVPGATAAEAVPFNEMLSAHCHEATSMGLLPCLRARMYRLEVFTFRRAPQRPCEWSPRRLLLEAPDEETVQDWAAAISRGIEAAAAGRPRSLLVVLNPNSGSRQSRRVWRRLVAPVFAAAGIKAAVRETRHQGHAGEIVSQLDAAQVQGIDGIVCVGGDGVFHECMNGLLQARAAASERGDAQLAAALAALRLAHIPAGSTDAVACTLHGTRGAFTAAMHIALGDSTMLDVMRVDTQQGTKFASCIAAYGFLADVTSEAERYRWLGPVRYDLVGAAKLAVSRAYPARIRYLEGEVGRALSKHSQAVCGAECTVCRTASFMHARRMSQQHMAASSSAAALDSSSCGGGSHHASPSACRAGRPGLAAAGSSGSLGSSRGGGGPSAPQSPVAAAAAPAGSALPAGDRLGCSPAVPHHFLQPAAEAAERHVGEEWQVLEGEFCSIMLIVMPCRSDKTKAGMARFGHLADGRIKLVLVSRCSPLQYLRFLYSMSKHGCAPGQLPYVRVLDAVAVEVEPLPGGATASRRGSGGGGGGSSSGGRHSNQLGAQPLSCWNLDGELVRAAAGLGGSGSGGEHMRIAAEVHHGLLRVFSRGVEQ